MLTGTEKPPEQGRQSAGEPSEVALGDYVTTREVYPVNVGELTYIAVAYARDHQVPITRRQCRTMATEAMRRMDAEHERLEVAFPANRGQVTKLPRVPQQQVC